MKAKIKDDCIDIYRRLMPEDTDDDLINFLGGIRGKVVDLVFTEGDAFEKNDNNFWLINEIWDEVR